MQSSLETLFPNDLPLPKTTLNGRGTQILGGQLLALPEVLLGTGKLN